MLRVFEAFAGYGGASFGLRRSGIPFKVVGQSDINKDANRLLAANFPDIKNYGDITKLNPDELPDFDLFTGGFPYQPFSLIGDQEGEKDRYGRGTLFADIIYVCSIKKPKYVLLENVKGFLSKKFEETFNLIKDAFKELGYGDIAYGLMNSKDYGMPQNRERVWIFARLGGLPEGFSIVPPKCPSSLRFKDLLDKHPDPSLYLTDERVQYIKEKYRLGNQLQVKEAANLDLYNRKVRTDGLSGTILEEHNVFYVVEPPQDGRETVRRMSTDERFRFMGFKDGELDYADLTSNQLWNRVGNGWDVNFVGILLKHIFSQL